jgi:hypothetical protein
VSTLEVACVGQQEGGKGVVTNVVVVVVVVVMVARPERDKGAAR